MHVIHLCSLIQGIQRAGKTLKESLYISGSHPRCQDASNGQKKLHGSRNNNVLHFFKPNGLKTTVLLSVVYFYMYLSHNRE